MGNKPTKRREYSDKLKDNRGYVSTYNRPGLKVVHIGNDVWSIGKSNHIKKGNSFVNHQVITGPDNKEYHLYDKDIIDMQSHHVNRSGNQTDQAKLKVYILTNILDNRKNWCFNLNSTPNVGKLKVIYENGTVKNIDFNGVFEPISIGRFERKINPIGYRLS